MSYTLFLIGALAVIGTTALAPDLPSNVGP